jgi:hypothetical protein
LKNKNADALPMLNELCVHQYSLRVKNTSELVVSSFNQVTRDKCEITYNHDSLINVLANKGLLHLTQSDLEKMAT